MLLAFCILIGAGVALFSPSWQASIPEQVSRSHLPAAVALGTISYNVARSFGPALGGLIVVLYGVKVVFGMTALLYLPLLTAFFLWRRTHVPSRLPPERIDRAILTGARYALHAPAVRTALLRVLGFGLSTATASALAPLIAKDLLNVRYPAWRSRRWRGGRRAVRQPDPGDDLYRVGGEAVRDHERGGAGGDRVQSLAYGHMPRVPFGGRGQYPDYRDAERDSATVGPAMGDGAGAVTVLLRDHSGDRRRRLGLGRGRRAA
jgi:hypothetical protein